MNHTIKTGVRTALLASAAAAAVSPGAFAQGAAVETVTVTGSRIAQRDYITDSPLTTVQAEQLQQTGSLTPEELLNTLPQVVPGSTTSSNNPGNNGTASIDLRGLGPNRNLVLVNGHRMMPFDDSAVVDLNSIPVALIERVEVISGGASAVYGADAVAGVVNFILKNDFQGVAVDLQYGQSTRGDGRTVAGSATVGGNFADGKGNAVISYDYSNREAIFKGARSFTAQATTQTSYFPEGSYRPSGNNATDAATDAYFAANGGAPATNQSGSTALGFNDDGSLFTVGTIGSSTSDVFNFKNPQDFIATGFFPDVYSFNFEPYNKLVLPLNRHTVTSLASYRFYGDIQAYMQASFTNYTSDTELAPTPAPTSSVNAPNGSSCGLNYCVPVSNPNIPSALATLLATRAGDRPTLVGTGAGEDFLIRRRFLEAGGRREVYTNDVWQITGGFRGGLGAIAFDVFGSFGRFDQLQTQHGNVSNSAVEQLLYGTNSSSGCSQATFDPFGPGDITQGCVDFVSRVTKNSQAMEFQNYEGSINGPLGDLPAGPIQFALGADYYSFDFDFVPDSLAATGDISGFNAQKPISGFVANKEVFGELAIPIIANQPYAQSVSLTLGARYTDHSTVGGISTYKAEANWAVQDEVRLRGSYQRAVRAPNISELFSSTFQDNPELVDPCNYNSPFRTGNVSGVDPAKVATLCAAQGVTNLASYVQPNSQLTAVSGGNPDLKEESADTFTLGVVYTPRSESPWFSGFNSHLDYWSIDIDGPIGISAGDILYQCFNAGGANPTYSNANENCRRLVTSPGSPGATGSRSFGDIAYISAFLTNLVSQKVSGVDLGVTWALDLADTVGAAPGSGRITFDFQGTWLNHYQEQSSALTPELEFAGTIGTNSGNYISRAYPKYKFTLTTGWDNGTFGVSSRINYIGKMNNSAEVVLGPGGTIGGLPISGTPAYWYFDFFANWKVTEQFTVRAGLLNAFDKEPPFFNPNVQDGTDPGAFDVVGRRFFVGANFKM